MPTMSVDRMRFATLIIIDIELQNDDDIEQYTQRNSNRKWKEETAQLSRFPPGDLTKVILYGYRTHRHSNDRRHPLIVELEPSALFTRQLKHSCNKNSNFTFKTAQVSEFPKSSNVHFLFQPHILSSNTLLTRFCIRFRHKHLWHHCCTPKKLIKTQSRPGKP